MGDPGLKADDFAKNFHLKPSRIRFRITPAERSERFLQHNKYIPFIHKKILLIDSAIRFEKTDHKTVIDLLVISKNPRLLMTNLASAMHIRQVVFDGSVPVRKTLVWKKDCDALGIPYYDVRIKGAFVMNL